MFTSVKNLSISLDEIVKGEQCVWFVCVTVMSFS